MSHTSSPSSSTSTRPDRLRSGGLPRRGGAPDDPEGDLRRLPDDPGRAGLVVLSHSVRARLVDLLAEGPATLRELTQRVAERLPASADAVEAHLRVLEAADFAWCLDPDGPVRRRRVWAGLDLEAFGERVDQFVDVLAAVRDAGDEQHAADAVGAVDAAWNGRRLELDLRRRAAVFWSTPPGQRHRARLEAGTLGVPAP